MIKQNLIYRNPLRLVEDENDELLPTGGFGAVLARAGVGKTALLVQVALDKMLRDHDVIHVSLDDPIKKVCLWYDEVFNNIAQQLSAEHGDKDFKALWAEAARHRFVMTFNVESLSVPKLEERMIDLTEQGIIRPSTLLIDGLSFDTIERELLADLKKLAKQYDLQVWFAVRTHRHEEAGAEGLPAQLGENADLFELALQLRPEGKDIHVDILKGDCKGAENDRLILDPATMLIRNRS